MGEGSSITAGSEAGVGGDITITAETLIASSASILSASNTSEGQGGHISLNVGTIE
jgi:hypothetical protein